MTNPSQPAEVVVIGNAGIDTCVYLYGQEIDFSVEANFTENLDYIGQAGGFASRGYNRLGKRTAFIGCVGDDPLGRWMRGQFEQDGIDTAAVFIDPAGTSRSINIMYRDGQRKNFYDGKSHMRLEPDLDACRRVLSGARLAHFNIPNWARRLLPAARDLGLVTACDIQDVVDPMDAYRQDFIHSADILFFSAANHPNPEPLMRLFQTGRPERIILAGMGSRGCALAAGGQVRFFDPPTLDLPVVDTNGAGDGLAVGFLSSYVLDGYSLDDSVLRGQITARFTCSLRADSSRLITRRQLDDLFALCRR